MPHSTLICQCLDLYVAFHAGAAAYLIPDEVSYIPQHLVTFLIQNAITVWYSVPSVLILMMEQAGLLDVAVSSLALRAILFAGEPFPIKHLRRLYQHYSPSVRFFNLYGPTETNVCTSYEVTHIPEGWNKPVPIGKACSGDHVWAQKEDGTVAQPGEEGELMVTGPTVMLGYWGQPVLWQTNHMQQGIWYSCSMMGTMSTLVAVTDRSRFVVIALSLVILRQPLRNIPPFTR